MHNRRTFHPSGVRVLWVGSVQLCVRIAMLTTAAADCRELVETCLEDAPTSYVIFVGFTREADTFEKLSAAYMNMSVSVRCGTWKVSTVARVTHFVDSMTEGRCFVMCGNKPIERIAQVERDSMAEKLKWHGGELFAVKLVKEPWVFDPVQEAIGS